MESVLPVHITNNLWPHFSHIRNWSKYWGLDLAYDAIYDCGCVQGRQSMHFLSQQDWQLFLCEYTVLTSIEVFLSLHVLCRHSSIEVFLSLHALLRHCSIEVFLSLHALRRHCSIVFLSLHASNSTDLCWFKPVLMISVLFPRHWDVRKLTLHMF